MTLSKHINSEELSQSIIAKTHKTPLNAGEASVGSQYDSETLLPYYEIPETGSSPHLVSKYLQEELSLDGNPVLNLASFVNTELDEVPLKLISDNLVKNLADNDEYPSLIEFQQRCITIISNLWNAPKKFNSFKKQWLPDTVGTACTGSSEAIMLAGLAMKKSWQEKRRATKKSTENPNIIMASCAQVALEKFANYFDVENRLVTVTAESGHVLDTTKLKLLIDENTIGVFVILGSTFTGAFEPVEKISDILDEVEQETGNDVKIHVDGASGGFVAPFIYPNLKWDFRIERVISINTSGHKFGLTTAGLGWVIWKDLKYLPSTLRFKLDYLGGVEETFNLNFSRPGFPVVHQYYNLLSLGREGYTKIFENCLTNARILSKFLEDSKYFKVLSVIHKPALPYTYSKEAKKVFNENFQPGLPVVAFAFSDDFVKEYPEIPQSILSLLLRNKGLIVPNYRLPPDEHEQEILRVVVKQNLSLNLLEKLMQVTIQQTELLIESCQQVRTFVEQKSSDSADKNLIYSLLLNIASNGVADLKAVQHKLVDDRNMKKHKHSFRGAC